MVRHCDGVGGEVTGLGSVDRARAATALPGMTQPLLCHRGLPVDLLAEFQRFADGTVRVDGGPFRRRRKERARLYVWLDALCAADIHDSSIHDPASGWGAV